MNQYSTYGRLDSRDLQGNDIGFVGFNNRLRPDQLEAGFVEICENGRLDRNGEWTPRNGVFNLVAPVTNDSAALAVNFGLRDPDFTGATKALGTGDNADSIVITATGHNYPVADNPIILNLTGLSDVVPATSDGLRPVTIIDNNTFKLTDKQYTNAGTNTVTITKPTLTDSLDVKIRGGGVFSDPNSNSNESYIILALTSSAKAVKISDVSATPIDIAYPSNQKVNEDCQVLQAFNKVFIFRKGLVAFEIDLAKNNIATSSNLQMNLVANGDFSQPETITATSFAIANNICTIVSSDDHKLKVGNTILCTNQGSSELIQNSFRRISNIDSFSVEPQEYSISTIKRSTGSSGIDSTSATRSSTTVRLQFEGVDLIDRYGINIGVSINVSGLSGGGSGTVNGDFDVTGIDTTSTTNDTLEYEVPSMDADISGTATMKMVVNNFQFTVGQAIPDSPVSTSSPPTFIKRVFSDLGFIHMPCPEFAELHNRRLIMPYQFDQSGTSEGRT